MFRYFENSQMLSQGFLLAMNADGEINEIDRTCRKGKLTNGVPEVASWFDAWTGLGDLLTRQAEDDIRRNRRISAAHKLRRASVYFGLCERYIPHTDPGKAQCYARMQAAFQKFIELMVDDVSVGNPHQLRHPLVDSPDGPVQRHGKCPIINRIDQFFEAAL